VITPPVAAASKPAPAPEAKPENGGEKDVEAAVKGWASAWSKKDVDSYFAAYTKEFDGGKGRKNWEHERRDRINGKRSISVKLSDIRVNINGNKATVSFHQDYRADSLSVSSGKKLELVRSGSNWLIAKESAGS